VALNVKGRLSALKASAGFNQLFNCGMLDGLMLFLARDVIYTSRAYATMSVSVCL